MPRVLNKRNGAQESATAVYVGRPTKYGNPFIVGVHGEQGECVQQFEKWIETQPQLIADVKKELKGKDLICWCHPRRCHADVLLKYANSPEDGKVG